MLVNSGEAPVLLSGLARGVGTLIGEEYRSPCDVYALYNFLLGIRPTALDAVCNLCRVLSVWNHWNDTRTHCGTFGQTRFAFTDKSIAIKLSVLKFF